MLTGNLILSGAARSRVPKLHFHLEKGIFRNFHSHSRSSGQQLRRRCLQITAFGPDPYAPLEKAIQVINRVLDTAQRKEKPGGKPRKERWVQFGAEASAKATLAQLTPGADPDYDTTATLLEEYLSLPVDQYSLLDPEWVCREEGSDNSFRVSIPLKDMLGVDMRPEVSIASHPNPAAGRVTLVGTRAVLGSPTLDGAFKLKLVAELRCKRRRRRLPDHIPGRPVYRMRQWAAKARGREWQEETTAGAIVALAAAPLPSEKVYISMGDPVRDSDDYEGEVAGSSGSEEEEAELMVGEIVDEAETSSSSSLVLASAASYSSNAAADPSSRALLDFSVNVTMAVRVPGPLRVVPNALLGYAGSMVAKTVLNAALPNFLTLLGSDFQGWVKAGGRREEGAMIEEGSLQAAAAAEGITTGLFAVRGSNENGSSGSGSGAAEPTVVVAKSEVVATSP